MKRNLIKRITAFIIIVFVLQFMSIFTYASSQNDIINYIKYASVILGYPYDDIVEFYNSQSTFEDFKCIIEYNVTETAELYYLDKYEILNEEVSIDLPLFSEITNIDIDILELHVVVFGTYRYSKLIEDYLNTYNINVDINTIVTTTQGIDALICSFEPISTYSTIPQSEWDDFYSAAQIGDIFITQDSTTEIISSTYRHGHVGVMQKTDSATKYITEATGSQTSSYDEVICRPLVTGWRNRKSLCLMYPDTSATNRSTAGNHTWYYAESNYYTYESNSYKPNMRNSNYKELNCAGLAYRVYKFMANYDIIPQVNDITIIKPKHIYQSQNMTIRAKNNILYEYGFSNGGWGLE